MNGRPGFRRGIVTVVGLVALAVVPVLALNSLATADTGGTSGSEGTTAAPRALTDAQRQCLADQGVTLPARPADGSRPELSQEQRDALRRAAVACGLPLRLGRAMRMGLTDAQRQCLADQGVTLPARSADGSRPELSQEQRDALRGAAVACGLPTRPPRVPAAGEGGTI